MRVPPKAAAVALQMIFIITPAFAQNQPVPPQHPQDNHEELPSKDDLYLIANGPSYLSYPLQTLKQSIPALKGLQYDSSQDRLPSILANVGEMIRSVSPKLPNLISRENIFHFQGSLDSDAARGAAGQPWSQDFKYLVLCHHNPDGSTTVEESRIDRKNRQIGLSDQIKDQHGLGFAYQWLLFSAGNQREFRFRYLGQERKNGRDTLVVAFAQTPGKVKFPASFQSAGRQVPFFYQGVFWVDKSTFDFVLLRTDLLAPIPSLQLRRLTTELDFRSVPIRGLDDSFWLPNSVDISTEQGNGAAEEVHRYSDYHLFRTTSTIIPTH